jgi:hypothetical protein
MGQDWPTRHTVEALFGSLDAAVHAAGTEPRDSHAIGE